MNDFVLRVLPVIVEVATNVFKGDEHKVQDAIGLCWYRYQQTDQRLEVTAIGHAWMVIRQILSRRNIPMGLRSSDPLNQPGTLTCAGMNGLADGRPGPDREAEARDTLDWLRRRLSPKHAAMVELIDHERLGTKELA